MRVLLEICVDDPQGIEAAVAGGADRLELCSALELGGLTPPSALIARAVESGLPVHAMIRPRSGGFLLKHGDVPVMMEQIRRTLGAGAAGIVIGALLPDRQLDQPALAAFRAAARDGAIVLHRAIDLTPDPVTAVEQVAALGFDGILSSGGARSAVEGATTLTRMVQAARGRITIMAGAGVTPENVGDLLARTGARQVHASASVADTLPGLETLQLGFAPLPRRITDAETVRRIRAAIMTHEKAAAKVEEAR